MYNCQTFAALPSEYWSVMPAVAVPRDLMRNTPSTLPDEVILTPCCSVLTNKFHHFPDIAKYILPHCFSVCSLC